MKLREKNIAKYLFDLIMEAESFFCLEKEHQSVNKKKFFETAG